MLENVTVIILTLNEEKNILECIKSVKLNGIKNIILIDASSKDKTVQIAKKLGAICYISKKTISFNRQLGIDKVKTKYAFFVDADNRLDKNCIKDSLKYLEQNKYAGVAAQKVRFPEMKDFWSKGWDFHNRMVINKIGEKLVIGTPALYLAKYIKETKYDTSTVSADDNILCLKLRKKGLFVATGPGLCYEQMVSSFSEFNKKLKGYGKGDAEFIIKNPDRFLNMGTHVLRNYFVRGQIRAFLKGELEVIPFYFLYGIIRFSSMVKTLFELKVIGSSSKLHPGYRT